MSLLSPVLLLGLLGLGLPIAAHLLGRERPVEVPFSAVRFLSQADPSVTRRRSLEDWPLMLLRLLLLALLIIALARPVSRQAGSLAVVAEPHDAIVLVDGSGSMDLRVDGEPILQHAVERANALVQSLPAGSRVGLLTSDPRGPRIDPSTDAARVEAAMQAWSESGAPDPGGWLLRDSLPAAAALLRDLEGDRKKVIYAVSDATDRGLGQLPASAEGGVIVIPVPAAPEDVGLPEHVGLESVVWEPAPDLDPRAVRIEAVVRRHTDPSEEDEPRPVTVALSIGEVEVARAQQPVPPNQDTPVEFTHILLDEAEAPATVSLVDEDDDPLPFDDRRYLWLSADDALEVAVVNGDPSELRAHDEVFFFTTAISATDEGRRIRMRSMAPDQLEDAVRERGASALDEIDVLVLANVRAPSPEVVPAIEAQVQRGMGLWVSVGDRIEPHEYNARLGDLLPLRLRGAIQVGTAPGRTEARLEGIAPADLSHPAFGGLEGDPGLTGTRVRRIVLLEPDARRQTRIALSYTSGAPALLTTEVGDGRVAMLTTSIDRDWTDLPLRPGFVPLVTGMLDWLSSARGGVAGTRVEVGEPRPLRTEVPVVVRTPTGHEVSVAPENGVAVFDETFVPGHYQVRSAADAEGEDERLVFVVEVDAMEADTTPVEVTPPQLQEGQEAVSIAVPRWRWLVFVGLLLLGLEAFARFWLSGRRKKA